MTGSIHRAFTLGTIALLAACSANASNPMIPASQSAQSTSAPSLTASTMTRGAGMRGAAVPPLPGAWALKRLCARPADESERRCDAIQRVDIAMTMHPSGSPQGYSPADLQSAYGLTGFSASNGAGQTVAIVDAYDDPKAESDLGVYRSTYGLPPCTTANGCFRKLNQKGLASPLPRKDAGWGGEESLDLDMVSASCPNCHILFIEASGAGTVSLDTAVNTAARLGATVISNSYGGGEYSKSDPAFVHPGIVITASAGDDDYYDCDPFESFGYACSGPDQPASFANVVAVGGTRLERASAGTRPWTETVWNDVTSKGLDYLGGTGSGCSLKVAKPVWQTDQGCTMRSETDVSADADPETPVAVYDSFPRGGWGAFGGTSVSSPLVAGIFALAGNAASVPQPQGLWQAQGAGFNDVVSGNNLVPTSVYRKAVSCPTAWSYICTAGVGYDGPSGWGTPNGIGSF
jgi:Subtilase family